MLLEHILLNTRERDQLFNLLSSNTQNNDNDSFRRELASCTGAIQTSLSQHMSKEEEQVFPLLIEKFPFQEQADVVWQFLCSIPVNMMVKFLPWLSSCISPRISAAKVSIASAVLFLRLLGLPRTRSP